MMWDYDTEDLDSYYPGYDEQYQDIEFAMDDYGLDEDTLEEYIRNEIDVKDSLMTLEDTLILSGYVWKQDYLIPEELIGG